MHKKEERGRRERTAERVEVREGAEELVRVELDEELGDAFSSLDKAAIHAVQSLGL